MKRWTIEEVENGFTLCFYPKGHDYSPAGEDKQEFVFETADDLVAKLEKLIGSSGVRTAAKRATGRMPQVPVLKRY